MMIDSRVMASRLMIWQYPGVRACFLNLVGTFFERPPIEEISWN